MHTIANPYPEVYNKCPVVLPHRLETEVISKDMAKKSKQPARKKSLTTIPSQADKLFDLMGHQIFQGNYTEAIANGERLLRYLPQHAPLRADVLSQLGVAHAMLQNYPQSYQAFTQALEITPNDAELWYNRGMASAFTSRFGRSLRDYERAKELHSITAVTGELEKRLKVARKIVKGSLMMRGPNFTLDQLIEQEDLFQRGLELMETGKWDEAAQAFQASIAMGDCLPQPWGNLGISLMMQQRYDEAEAALRRALVIDPKYTLAKQNLAMLPEIRRTGPPKIIGMNDPFKDGKPKQSITFLMEG
jgi:tetratricopeptide (TPR) repeat protein